MVVDTSEQTNEDTKNLKAKSGRITRLQKLTVPVLLILGCIAAIGGTSTIPYFIAVLFGLLAVFVLFTFVYYDITQMKRYNRAKRCMGRVVDVLEEKKIAAYGRTQGRVYREYRVQFNCENGWITDTILVRNQKLEEGDSLEIHYEIDEEGVHLLNNVSARRLKEVAISFTIVIPLCVLAMYLQKKGLI